MNTVTGRMSVSIPAWQDLPKEGEAWKAARKQAERLKQVFLSDNRTYRMVSQEFPPTQRKAMKLKCSHVSTCTSDHWGGHAKAHISVPVTARMTAEELRAALKSEVYQCVGGSDLRFYEYHDSFVPECLDAAEKAIDDLHIPDGPLFLGLPEQEEGDDSVYAYFIFEDDE